MGFFSWECKGCHQELIEQEIVRLRGCVGEYDGYGGAGAFSAGDSDDFEPPAWHELCYQAAPDKEKLDETPSKHASNQGAGYPRWDCMSPRRQAEYVEPPRVRYADIATADVHKQLDIEWGEYGEAGPGQYSPWRGLERSQITDDDIEQVKLARGERWGHPIDEPEEDFHFGELSTLVMELAYAVVATVRHRKAKEVLSELLPV